MSSALATNLSHIRTSHWNSWRIYQQIHDQQQQEQQQRRCVISFSKASPICMPTSLLFDLIWNLCSMHCFGPGSHKHWTEEWNFCDCFRFWTENEDDSRELVSLPFDILFDIMSQVPKSSLASARLACKALRKGATGLLHRLRVDVSTLQPPYCTSSDPDPWLRQVLWQTTV